DDSIPAARVRFGQTRTSRASFLRWCGKSGFRSSFLNDGFFRQYGSMRGSLSSFFAPLPCLALGCGPAPLEPRDPDPGSEHFVVESYNIQDTTSGDPVTLGAIGAANAEVICLQEVTPVWEQSLRGRYADAYPYMLFHALDGSEGLGFMSRVP